MILENSSIRTEDLGVFDKIFSMTGSFWLVSAQTKHPKHGGFHKFNVQNLMFFAGKPKKQGIFGGVSLNFLELPLGCKDQPPYSK